MKRFQNNNKADLTARRGEREEQEMGNRAVITTKENWKNGGVGIYLHWNGGRDSVEAFLKYCELKGFRSPSSDSSYGMARLCQVISNFFGGGLSVGINTLWHLDCNNFDNGVYIIEGWEIVDRAYFDGEEQNEYDLNEMLWDIDQCQPKDEQLGDFLKAEERAIEDIKVGDEVYFVDYNGKVQHQTVVGIGEDRFVNGTNVKGIPYMDLYENDGSYTGNINNYLIHGNYRV